MNIMQAFGLVALGMLIAHIHDWFSWRKYYEGLKAGRAYGRDGK